MELGHDTSSKVFYKEFSLLVLGKAVLFRLHVYPPILLLNIPFWQILIGFTIVNLTAGLYLQWFSSSHTSLKKRNSSKPKTVS